MDTQNRPNALAFICSAILCPALVSLPARPLRRFRNEVAMAADNRSTEHESGTLVLLKDFYNVREVAALLHWSRGRVYTMAERKVDPSISSFWSMRSMVDGTHQRFSVPVSCAVDSTGASR